MDASIRTADLTQWRYVGSVYSECAEAYADAFHNEATVAVDIPRLERLVHLSNASRGRVLDIGCGSGMHAGYFASRGLTWIGVDVASGMFAAGRRRGVSESFVQADVSALPIRSGAADMAIALESLVHMGITGLRRTLVEIRRVLCPGGYALLGLQIGYGERSVRYPIGPGRVLEVLLLDEHLFAEECRRLALEVTWLERRRPLSSETEFEKLMAIVKTPC
jgi:ubiquinone/menaquinone biosynthesis C-methylase UbiE